MRFVIIWNSEEIDESESLEGARFLCTEYNLAFHGGCTVRRKRSRPSTAFEKAESDYSEANAY